MTSGEAVQGEAAVEVRIDVWTDEDGRAFADGGVAAPSRSVLQPWVMGRPFMQQSVLLTAVRGPDGLPKYHPTKYVLRWYRRAILLSSFEGRVIDNPWEDDGGSFLGPSVSKVNIDLGNSWQTLMNDRASDYVRSLDEVPHHFQLHLMHAAEIVGYHHPKPAIAGWWHGFYVRLASDMHLHPETAAELDARLSDSRSGWLARADPATIA